MREPLVVAGFDRLLFEELLELAVEHGGGSAGGVGVGDARTHGFDHALDSTRGSGAKGRAEDLGPAVVEHASAEPDPRDEHEHAEADTGRERGGVPRRVDEEPERGEHDGGNGDEERAEHRDGLHERGDRAPVDCGCWNGLSPGFTAGYGNRADAIEPTPSPANRSAVLTPRSDGSSRQSSSTNTVTALPRPMTSAPAMSTGTRRPARSSRPFTPDATCSQMAVLSNAVSLCSDHPRSRHMRGTGMSAVYMSGMPARPSGTITSSGTTGTMRIETQ